MGTGVGSSREGCRQNHQSVESEAGAVPSAPCFGQHAGLVVSLASWAERRPGFS